MGDQANLTETKRTVPAKALCFNVGAFEFAAAKADAKPGDKVPVKLLGRTGQPISHWYWGNVVHDMAGMKLHKERLPIDYCHYADEVIGYLDDFDTKSGDLLAAGELVPFKADDRASEVIFKSSEGIPYEASINFGGAPMRLEELQRGTSATVNGHVVQGPAIIIREWTLRGIAICPYGADMNTKTELSADQDEIEITIFTGGKMPETENKTPADPAAKPPEGAKQLDAGKPEPKPEPKPEAKPGAEFVATFGDVGARWFLEGRSFADCAAEFVASQKKKIDELTAANESLTQQLANTPKGNEPVKFNAAPKGNEKPLPQGVTGGAAVFADAMANRKQ